MDPTQSQTTHPTRDGESHAVPGERASVIGAVQTPLGFFALALLVVEGGMGVIVAAMGGPDATHLLFGMLMLLALSIIVVGLLAAFRPEIMSGPRGTTRREGPGSARPETPSDVPSPPAEPPPRRASGVVDVRKLAGGGGLRPGVATILDPQSPVRINFRDGGRRRNLSGLVENEVFKTQFDDDIRCILHIRSPEFHGAFIVALSARVTSVSFGSDDTCDVVIGDVNLSRGHFKLFVEGPERSGASPTPSVRLLDMSGRTHVDGRTVAHESIALPDRCCIRAGQAEIWFWSLTPPEVVAKRLPAALAGKS
jgi:hypothetical protein